MFAVGGILDSHGDVHGAGGTGANPVFESHQSQLSAPDSPSAYAAAAAGGGAAAAAGGRPVTPSVATSVQTARSKQASAAPISCPAPAPPLPLHLHAAALFVGTQVSGCAPPPPPAPCTPAPSTPAGECPGVPCGQPAVQPAADGHRGGCEWSCFNYCLWGGCQRLSSWELQAAGSRHAWHAASCLQRCNQRWCFMCPDRPDRNLCRSSRAPTHCGRTPRALAAAAAATSWPPETVSARACTTCVTTIL